MAYYFTCWLVNLLTSEVVQFLAGQVVNLVCTDVGDVLSFAVEYFSVHCMLLFRWRSMRTLAVLCTV